MSAQAHHPASEAQAAHAELFAPLRIGSGLSLSNRFVVAPMTRVSVTAEGHATKQMVDYHEAFAAGGFGLVITEGIYTDKAQARGYFSSQALPTTHNAIPGEPLWSVCTRMVAASLLN